MYLIFFPFNFKTKYVIFKWLYHCCTVQDFRMNLFHFVWPIWLLTVFPLSPNMEYRTSLFLEYIGIRRTLPLSLSVLSNYEVLLEPLSSITKYPPRDSSICWTRSRCHRNIDVSLQWKEVNRVRKQNPWSQFRSRK